MKFHLLTKMILFILLPALAGQALIAGLSYQRSSRAMQEQLENHMALMVKMQADGLLHVYEGLVREMQELGESGPVRDLQTAHGKVDGATMTALRQRASAYLAEVAERHPVVSLIGITDATGRITAHSVARSIGTSRASKGYFQRAMKGISSTEDVKSETTGEFRTFFCIPILGGADGKTPIGSMYAAIHNYKLARMSINSVAVGKSGLSFVYNTDGVVVMHPDAVNIGRNDGELEHVRRLVQGSGAVAVRRLSAPLSQPVVQCPVDFIKCQSSQG